MIAAIFLMLFIFILPVLSRSLRTNAKVLWTYVLVISLHQFVAIMNAFVVTTFGADIDAARFHEEAVILIESGGGLHGIGSFFYIDFLSYIYRWFGDSIFLGEELSILAFSLSCVVLLKINACFFNGEYPAFKLFLFGALPTMVLLGSVTLRESFQILFLMLTIWYGLRLRLAGRIVGFNLIGMIFAVSIMGMLHKGLVPYGVFICFLFLWWTFSPSLGLMVVRKNRVFFYWVWIPLVGVGVVFLGGSSFQGLELIQIISSGDALDFSSSYREAAPESARASYGLSIDMSSLPLFLWSIFLLLLYYLFSPFPWQLSSIIDVYAFMEAAMVLLLLSGSFKRRATVSGYLDKKIVTLLLVVFFSMSILWALGTSNYGTAMRHHMLTWWILVLLGTAEAIASFRKIKRVVE